MKITKLLLFIAIIILNSLVVFSCTTQESPATASEPAQSPTTTSEPSTPALAPASEPTPTTDTEPAETVASEPAPTAGAEPAQTPAASEETSKPLTKQPTSESELPQPLDWLRNRPFEQVTVRPLYISKVLPEGFTVSKPNKINGPLPSGQMVQVTSLDYCKSTDDGRIDQKTMVTVDFYGYDKAEARNAHLDIIESEGYEWTFEEIGDSLVAKYTDSGAVYTDGRAWVSGPYLIAIHSLLVESQPESWVNKFTEMYLENFPGPK